MLSRLPEVKVNQECDGKAQLKCQLTRRCHMKSFARWEVGRSTFQVVVLVCRAKYNLVLSNPNPIPQSITVNHIPQLESTESVPRVGRPHTNRAVKRQVTTFLAGTQDKSPSWPQTNCRHFCNNAAPVYPPSLVRLSVTFISRLVSRPPPLQGAAKKEKKSLNNSRQLFWLFGHFRGII